MEPDIDEPKDELITESVAEEIRQTNSKIVQRLDSCFAGQNRYVPWLWARHVSKMRGLGQHPLDPSELYHLVDLTPTDKVIFPELLGRSSIRFNLCEDGEVYELPDLRPSGVVMIDPEYVKELLERAVTLGMDLVCDDGDEAVKDHIHRAVETLHKQFMEEAS